VKQLHMIKLRQWNSLWLSLVRHIYLLIIDIQHHLFSATTNFFLIRFFTRFLELDVDWLGQMMTVSHSFSPDLNIWTYYCLTVSMRTSNSGWDFKVNEISAVL